MVSVHGCISPWLHYMCPLMWKTNANLAIVDLARQRSPVAGPDLWVGRRVWLIFKLRTANLKQVRGALTGSHVIFATLPLCRFHLLVSRRHGRFAVTD